MEAHRDVVKILVEEVGVQIEGHCSGGVPEHSLDRFDVGATAGGTASLSYGVNHGTALGREP